MKRILIVAVMAVTSALGLYAASTGTTALHTVTGAGADTTNGDFISNHSTPAPVGIGAPYRYFIEVPPGLSRLSIDIFDPDIGLGGTTEAAAGRDRDRTGFDTTATYSLIGPDGISRPVKFTTGSATQPAGSDNAWVSFYDWTGDTVRDNFTTATYTNNDGTVNWSSNWVEGNDATSSPTAGKITITAAGQLQIDGNGASNLTVDRGANLSGWSSATLKFDFITAGVDAGDVMRVQVWNNNTNTYDTLETFTGPFTTTTSRTYTLSAAQISANSRIRFAEGTGYGNNDDFRVDYVEISRGGGTLPNGHWELDVDETATTGDDINAFGIRASDGNTGSGGTELAIYADSFVSIGVNPPASGTSSRSYTFYPYITSGCTCAHNDFDFDSNSGNVGSMLYTSRSGSFPKPISSSSLSAGTAWAENVIKGWTDDTKALDYGIWSLQATINSYVVNGNPNGNYATLWDSNYITAGTTPNANPPTANPQANAFRIYLPTDAGTAPVKPYLEQQVVQRGGGALAIGVQKRYTVTVRMANPTANAITFSATHVVTANVPGSGAVYGGNAQIGQGSILSQPAVGGTGNITWNPGTLAAGATSILSYDVLVTATNSGQRIPVTATPASGNGTRAQFVDGTGNTTQARALFTFGPLCEVAAVQSLATEVLLSSFDASVHGNVTLVKWETASEAGTIGFNLYRVDRTTGELTLANDSLLAANPGAPQGGHYRFVDKDNTDEQPSYMLEEITVDGRALQYGPFAASGDSNDDALPDGDYDLEPRTEPKNSAPSSHAHKPKPAAAMAGVKRTGITRINGADLAAALDMPQAAIDSAIKTGRVSITDRGADIAWLAASDNDSVLFFGDAPDSIFSNDHVYRVSLDKGTPMRAVDTTPAPEQATAFVATKQFETNAFAATVLPLDPDSDYWFWDFVISGNATFGKKSFTIDVPAVASTDGAALQVRLQGAAQSGHRARLSLNGTVLGDVTWNALDGSSNELTIPSGVLRDGANVVTVQGVLVPGTSFDVFYVDGFAVRYTRAARGINGTLEMSTTPGSVVTATSLATDALAFDITNRRQPVLLRGGASFVAPSNTTSVFFSDLTAINGPSFIRSSARPSLSDRKNRADYLVITNDAVRGGADALAQLRARDGLQTMVVDLDDIYDEFAGGNVTPHAIHDFLAATRAWATAPRYVVLAGIGTLDYRGISTSAGLVPPILTKTSNGLFAADSLFADFDGDGIPEIALGRIPASNNDELLAYVAKLDASAHSANGDTLFSADAADHAASFKRESSLVEEPLAGRPLSHVYVDDLGAAAARATLLARWKNGASLVNWIGHGGVDRISNASLLTVNDAPSLTSATGVLPVFVAMTCTINRFEIGSVQALGTSLTVAPNAGALAVWSASGLSTYSDATLIEKSFMNLAASTDHPRLGDLIVQSLNANKSIGETAAVYLLLGDPAIPLSLPPIPASGQPAGGVE